MCRALGALLAATSLATCGEPTSPVKPGFGAVSVRPFFDANARVVPLTLDNIRVIVVRPTTDTVADLRRSFSVSNQQLQLNIPVALTGASESFDVTLELYAGTTLLFRGTSSVSVSAGPPSGTPNSVPVAYQGPGTNIASVLIGPRDTTVTLGATFPFGITATDSNAAGVTQFYVSWVASAGSVDGAGGFTAPTTRDTVQVVATTPTGIADTTNVFVVAPPSVLLKTSGDGQTGTVGGRLAQPLAVQVNGSDGLAVPGVAVTFAAVSGGGSVDSATATTDAQGIARTGVTLGPTAGAQSFSASAPGLAAVTFTATASGIAPAAVTLAAGSQHTCEIRGGTTLCWGDNTAGQLGDGTTTTRLVPTAITGSFTSLALGADHSCALTAAGNAFCWGNNSAGELGTGNLTPSPAPVAVSGGQTFVQLVAGSDFTCGLTAAGQAFCWGEGAQGQVGDGGSTARTVPTAVAGGHVFATLGAGASHACGIATDGAAWCWGFNFDGQLGNGGFATASTPSAVNGGLTFTSIDGAFGSTCAVATGGAGYCWGNNFGTQLTTPTPTAGGFTYTALVMGNFHVCGLTSGGWRCAGDNAVGQLGDGTAPTDQVVPVLPAGGFTYTALAAGGAHTCGRTTTNTTRCWGQNAAGQLGDGSTTGAITPILSVGPATQVAVNAGNGQSATVSTAVAVNPSVLVRDAASQPVPGVAVTFAVTAGGGSLTGATTLTDAAGLATVGSWTLGANPGTNTLAATVAGAGVAGNPVSFTATGTAVSPFNTWTGAVDTAWATAGNWSKGTVPTSSDDVVIPSGTPRAPYITGFAGNTRDLTVAAGAVLTAQAPLNVNGSADIAGSVTGNVSGVTLLGTGTVRGTLVGTFFLVTVNGTYTLNGRLRASGITINGRLTLAGHTAEVGSSTGDDFQTANLGVLVMTNPLDSLIVGGAGPTISFDGGSTVGTLTAGTILLNSSAVASFTQGNTFNDSSFAASGTHKVVLASAGTVLIGMDTPGTGSQFQDLDLTAQTAGLSLTAPVTAFGRLISTPSGAAPAINGTNRLLTVTGGAQVTGLTLTNTRVALSGASITFDNALFQSMNTAATQLTVSGTGGTVSLTNTFFGTTPASGFYLAAVDTDGATGGQLTVDLVNPSPSTPGSFTTVTGGAVINWPAGTPVKTWTGAISTAWTTAGNWSPAAVPTSTDDVLIPNGPSLMPVLGTSTSIQSLTLQNNASLTLINVMTLTLTGDLDDAGNLTSGGGSQTIDLAGTGRTFRSTNIPNPITVNVTGSYTLAGRAAVTDLLINGSGALTLGGHTMAVSNNFNLAGGGTLVMAVALDSLRVLGTANFAGADLTGLLTDGVLEVGGALTQTGAGGALAASGTHKTRLTSANPSVFFQSPGPGAGSSHLQELEWVGGGTLSLQSLTYVLGTMTVPAGGSINGVTFTQSLHTGLFVNGGPVTFNSAQLWIEPATAVPVAVSDLTFTSGSSSRLYIRHPGRPAGAPLTLTNIAFTTVPPFPAVYLDVDDTAPLDNNALVVDLFNPTPAASGGLVLTANGAVINWPAATPAKTWLGTTSDWHTTTNWSPAGLPTASDDVVIPVTANNPFLSAPATTRSLTIQSGAIVNLNGFGLDVAGDLVAPTATSMTGGGGTLTLSGATRTLGGTLGAVVPVSVTGTYSLTARTTMGGLTITGSGDVAANGQTLVVGGALNTVGSGTLTMTNALDSVLVSGAGIFGGGFTGGRLTAGYLKLGGSFNQTSGTTSGSFAASGTHQTELGAAAVRVATFANPGFGTGTSQFNDLIVSGATGGLTLNSDVAVLGKLIAVPPGATPTLSGSNRTLTARGGTQVTGLIMDGVALAVDAGASAGTIQMSGVTFQNMPTTVTQLAITHPGAVASVDLANMIFNTVPSSGLYLQVTDADGPSPNVLTVNLFTTSPATSGGLAQALGGAVINWPGVVPATQWTGTTSGDWNTAANWSTGAVPIATTSVVIPAGTPNAPTLSANAFTADLTVAAGVTVDVGTFTLQVAGNLDVQAGAQVLGSPGLVTMAGANKSLVGFLNSSLAVTGNTLLAGNTVVGHDVTIDAALDLGTFQLVASGNFTAQNGGLLVMTQGGATLNVTGNVLIDGAPTSGFLTAGTLIVGGNFLQFANNASGSFAPSGTHTTVLLGATPTVAFQSPGPSGFRHLSTANATTLTLASAVPVSGDMIMSSVPGTITGANVNLTVGNFSSGFPITFNNIPLVVTPSGALTPLDDLTFININPTGTALTIQDDGAGGPVQFTNLTFSYTPTAGGFFLTASDVDGAASGVLTIDMTNPTPGTAAGQVQVLNGAVVNWPTIVPSTQWTGAVNTDWNTPGNWSSGSVPTLATDVVIPIGSPGNPVVTSSCQAKSIDVNSTKLLDVGTFGCTVAGNVTVSGGTAGTGSFTIVAPGQVEGNLRGIVAQAPVTQSDISAIIGDLVIDGAGASFAPAGFSAVVSGNLDVINGGLLVMTNAGDALTIQGNATFDGGDELNQLTAGTLTLVGNFTQLSTGSSSSFATSGTFVTVLAGSNPTVSFATTVASAFMDLLLPGPMTVTLASNVPVAGTSSASRPARPPRSPRPAAPGGSMPTAWP
ncbi:MAG: hypothetical protein IPK12_07140 [Gemmatimonadetes bacterium]|nr:hypothetical protein [Gemmatimonadota bacterium]